MLGFTNLHGQSQWFVERIKDIDEAEQLEPEARIEKIGQLVRIADGQSLSEEQKIVLEKVRSLLLATPGHAKYYLDQLNAAREAVKAHQANYNVYADAQGDLEILGYLPDPETVSVLGELVGNPESRDGKLMGGRGNVSYGDGYFPVTAKTAARALNLIGIEGGPIIPEIDWGEWSSVDKWNDWWQEVKSGKRTYRFKGSVIEYGLDGPVPSKEPRRARPDRQSKNQSTVNVTETEPEGAKFWLFTSSIVATLLIVLVGWYFRRKSLTQ